jgi:glycosyltransferase involved in cell wall biosynthesis
MSILFLDQFSELGGGQQALLNTVEAVRQQGWEARALVPGRGPLVEALRSRDVVTGEIPCGPYRSGSKSAADSLRFALDLRGQVRIIGHEIARANIDLIYVNGPRLLPAASLAARGRVPLVFHVHTHLSGSALRLARWSVRSGTATVIGCSKSVLEPLHREEHVIPNGVRDAGYRERDLDRAGHLRIGMIGRVAPEKGQMEFVRAISLLKDEFPQTHFVICGAALFDADRDFYQVVRLQARDLPVEFIGWQQDITRVLHDLDLLAVPSLEEGMGRVVLEAFSAGVPVVAFPAGGIPEAVIDGETGFLTHEFSGVALAARIRHVIAARADSVRQIARKAREAWARSYSLTTYQKNITKLLETLAPVHPENRVAAMPLQHR